MQPLPSIRGEYEQRGAKAYYEQFGTNYRNPHESIIVESLKDAATRWAIDLSHVLDLAAGSGEATLALRAMGARRIDAIDPFTVEAYFSRTGAVAEPFYFADVAAGVLAGRHYSMVVCSFALHLCEKSRLPGVVQQLAQVSDALLIVSPHKRPVIREEWAWKFVGENVIDRVRSRYYKRAGAL